MLFQIQRKDPRPSFLMCGGILGEQVLKGWNDVYGVITIQYMWRYTAKIESKYWFKQF